jgi:hypothetical protein
MEAIRHLAFLPQAVIGKTIDQLPTEVLAEIEEGIDELDEYIGAAFLIEDPNKFRFQIPFKVVHYRGHPPATFTVYFPQQLSGVNEITLLVSYVVKQFGFEPDAIRWQRADSPEL